MSETKYRMEFFAFYDYSGIRAHLEEMAQKGWLLEKMGTYLWRYRRIEPEKVHIAVTYLPKISCFDPKDAEEQLQMEEYCTKDGWRLAARNAQMQIFYHEGQAPVPIETDAVTQIETIHRAMCRSLLPSYGVLALLCILQIALLSGSFSWNPIYYLSTPAQLYMPLAWLLLLFSNLYRLGNYICWYRKAKKAAENGIFPESKGSMKVEIFFGILALLFLVLGLKAYMGLGIFLWIGVGTILLIGISNAVRCKMQACNVSRGKTRIISMALSIFLAFVMIRGTEWYMLHREPEPVGYYNIDGWDMEVFDAPLPLYIEDLMQTTQKDWSTNAQPSETFLISNTYYDQRPLTQDEEVPSLSYAVTDVKVPALYPFCKSAWLTRYKDDEPDKRHFESADAAPWHAQEVYQLYRGSESTNEYLLCYEDRFVNIDFDWELTAEQMAIVGQKLGR